MIDPTFCPDCHKLWEECRCSINRSIAMATLDLTVAQLVGHAFACPCSECEGIRNG